MATDGEENSRARSGRLFTYSPVTFGRAMRPTHCGQVSTPHVYASFLGSLHGSHCEVAEPLPSYHQDAARVPRLRCVRSAVEIERLGILGSDSTSFPIHQSAWKGNSAKFALTEFSEAHLIPFTTNLAQLSDTSTPLTGVCCTRYVEPDKARRYRERMKRYLAALLVVLGLAGIVGVLAVGRGFADAENTSRAKCSKATLKGTYLFAQNGVEIKGMNQRPFAFAGYDVYDGNGKIDSVVSGNANGQVIRKGHTSGTYIVKADCTGTATFPGAGEKLDLFIAPDGSMFTFVFVKPTEVVTSGFEERATAKRVAP